MSDQTVEGNEKELSDSLAVHIQTLTKPIKLKPNTVDFTSKPVLKPELLLVEDEEMVVWGEVEAGGEMEVMGWEGVGIDTGWDNEDETVGIRGTEVLIDTEVVNEDKELRGEVKDVSKLAVADSEVVKSVGKSEIAESELPVLVSPAPSSWALAQRAKESKANWKRLILENMMRWTLKRVVNRKEKESGCGRQWGRRQWNNELMKDEGEIGKRKGTTSTPFL